MLFLTYTLARLIWIAVLLIFGLKSLITELLQDAVNEQLSMLSESSLAFG